MRPPAALLAALALLLGATAAPAVAEVAPVPGAPTITAAPATAGTSQTRVLAVSVDGLKPAAVRRLGRERTPTLHRLLAQGSATLNARTVRERTETLPNHTSMVTGRRIDARRGGHGVTWNTHLAHLTVQDAAGEEVESVFTSVDGAGGSAALFAGKKKLTLFPRSWPGSVDRFTYLRDEASLVRAARADLLGATRELTFLHLALPDRVGHDAGFGSSAYLDAVARVDVLLGRLVTAIEGDAELRSEVVVVLTSDHGGIGTRHDDPTRLANYRVPFLVWGPTVRRGDLYTLNPTRQDPGRQRTTYAAERPPVRNADLANVVTDLLGLPPVPGSQFDQEHDLVVTVP